MPLVLVVVVIVVSLSSDTASVCDLIHCCLSCLCTAVCLLQQYQVLDT